MNRTPRPLPLLALFPAFLAFLATKPSTASFCESDGWSVAWSDEFTSGPLDTTKWSIASGGHTSISREALATSDNVWIQDGALILRTRRQLVGDYAFTTGAVRSQGRASWQSGRVCVSAKLPGVGGLGDVGLWPAHWMMPDDPSCWPDHGEIDLMEMVNGDGVVHSTYHWSNLYPGQPCANQNSMAAGTAQVSNWAGTYHEYAVEFGEGFVHFVLDGATVRNVTSNNSGAMFTAGTPFYLILQTAVGGPWPSPPNNSTLPGDAPAFHSIDYVRVAQRSPLKHPVSIVEEAEEPRPSAVWT